MLGSADMVQKARDLVKKMKEKDPQREKNHILPHLTQNKRATNIRDHY